jgi:hypothetical protein
MTRARSPLQPARARFARLLDRLGRTSFRDRSEREILLAELGRTIGELPSAAGEIQTSFDGGDGLALDSLQALAAVEDALRALEEPESGDAWVHRLARLEDGLSLLLAAEEDLLDAFAAQAPVPAAEAQLAATA